MNAARLGRTRRLTWSLCAVLILGSGCTGSLKESNEDVNQDDDPAPDDGGGGASQDPPALVEVPEPDACKDVLPGLADAPLRRLTNDQFRNTVADLWPEIDVAALDLRLAETVSSNGFAFRSHAREQAASELFVSDLSTGIEAVTLALFGDPARAAKHLGGAPTSKDEALAQARAAIVREGRRIFRRPLTDGELERFTTFFAQKLDSQDELAEGVAYAAALTWSAMMHDPHFIFLETVGTGDGERTRLTDHEIAARMSFLLWDSTPDDALLDAADEGRLTTVEGRVEQAQRLLADQAHARRALLTHFTQWIDADRVLGEIKEDSLYPGWTDQVKQSLREQTVRYLEDVVVKGPGTVKALFETSDYPTDPQLAQTYGVTGHGGEGWQTLAWDAEQRRGVLGLPGMLAGLAHPQNGSPTLRGVFILERVLCLEPPPPPADFTPEPPSVDVAKTNREVYEQHLANASCASCHSFFDGMGFALEHFDSVGQYRTEDNGHPINPTGDLVGTDVDGTVTGAVELATKLASSRQVLVCTAQHWFEYAFARDFNEQRHEDECAVQRLAAGLEKTGGKIAQLLVALVASDEFIYRL